MKALHTFGTSGKPNDTESHPRKPDSSQQYCRCIDQESCDPQLFTLNLLVMLQSVVKADAVSGARERRALIAEL
jgi:hypothetical protein